MCTVNLLFNYQSKYFQLQGVVIIIADDGKYIHIEDGATLEDKLVLQSRTLEYY